MHSTSAREAGQQQSENRNDERNLGEPQRGGGGVPVAISSGGDPQSPAGLDSSLVLIHEVNCGHKVVKPDGKKDLWRTLQNRKKLSLDYAAEFKKRLYTDEANRLRSCSSWVQIREFLLTGNRRLRAANWCNQPRICPSCGHVAAVRTAVRIAEKVREVILSEDTVPILLTFTIKNGPSLRRQLETLLDALQSVRERIRNSGRGRRARNAWEALRGAIVRVEIKRGKGSGEWHVHAHAIAMRKRQQLFDYAELQQDWRKILGGGHDAGNLDFQTSKAAIALVQSGGRMSSSTEELLFDDVLEVSKYLAKFGEITPADLVHCYSHTRGRRLAFTWGNLWGVQIEDRPEGDLTEEDGPFRDYLAVWVGSRFRPYRVQEFDAEGMKLGEMIRSATHEPTDGGVPGEGR